MTFEEELGEALLGKPGDVGLESVSVSGRLTQLDQELEVLVPLSQFHALLILTMLHYREGGRGRGGGGEGEGDSRVANF